MNKKVLIGAVMVVCVLALIGSCSGDSEYESVGKSFGSWVNTDPSGWSDTQKDYFNNFMDWADKN